MKTVKKKVYLIFALSLFSCANQAPVKEFVEELTKEPDYKTEIKTEIEPTIIQAPPQPEYFLTILAAGDNLYHDVMIRDGENGDYESIYSEIRSLVQSADIAFINQETILGGKEYGFSGYPMFNSPRALGRAISATGFNVINHANNHVMDMNEAAVISTLDFWDAIPEVTILGVHRSEEERSRPILVEQNNITLGFLSYTYGLSYIPLPEDKPYFVSLINTEVMAKEIDALRPLCDFLLVSMHWGEEYFHQYNASQKELALFLAEHRVDLVIGHHPHVLQAIEHVPRPDGKTMLCFYSLGNLISAQARIATMLGALAYIKIKKSPAQDDDENYSVSIMDAGAIPIVTHYGKNYTGFKVYPLYSYTKDLLDKHRINEDKTLLTLDYLNEIAATVLKQNEIDRNPFN